MRNPYEGLTVDECQCSQCHNVRSEQQQVAAREEAQSTEAEIAAQGIVTEPGNELDHVISFLANSVELIEDPAKRELAEFVSRRPGNYRAFVETVAMISTMAPQFLYDVKASQERQVLAATLRGLERLMGRR